MLEVNVIGAGLAGCEAAWQLAQRGIHVTLTEMKPKKMTPAHHCADFAELVCSNSLRGDRLENAVGLLKEELRRLHSLILTCAEANRVEAGGALAVDRYGFSGMVTEKIKSHPNITVVEAEETEVPAGPVIIATGPLTSDAMSAAIQRYFGGQEYMSFFDAAAPLVTFSSIDMDKAWFASRYDRGDADYVNCAMDKDEYLAFVDALSSAEEAPVHGFEDKHVFEGCMPVEVMARRGIDTLRYGPLKPVGLKDPKTGHEPYAVVQLRQDNATGTLYNLVGFQTRLKWGEQKRVFGMIPGLENAEFARYGVMHRNTFLHSPGFLNAHFEMISRPQCYFAGQMTGVEGYVESAASGLFCGLSLGRDLRGLGTAELPGITAMGAMGRYVSTPNRDFQPMNCTFGLLDGLLVDKQHKKIRNKQERYTVISERSLSYLRDWVTEMQV